MGVNGLRHEPWPDGTLYVLRRDTCGLWNEWMSRAPVRPLMRLAVKPDDMPKRDQVVGADFRQPGSVWVQSHEPFPFLKDVQAIPIRPSGRPAWLSDQAS